MKKKALLLSALFPLLGMAQSVVRYAYDAVGNRVRRELVVSQQQAPQQQAPSAQYTDDLSDDYRVRLRSDASGVVHAEVLSVSGQCDGTVTVYDLQGQQVTACRIADGSAEVDLGGSPAGVYILHIEIGNKSTDWKIIRK